MTGSEKAPSTPLPKIKPSPESAEKVGAQPTPPPGRIFAKTEAAISLAPVTVTVAASSTWGVIGFTLAVMVPVGARKVIACMKGVATDVAWELSQMQKTNVPGVRHVSAPDRVTLHTSVQPQRCIVSPAVHEHSGQPTTNILACLAHDNA
ncbi:MAG: hypothetical protein ACR2H2_04525 [Solirubrobacteraceae bacterium]